MYIHGYVFYHDDKNFYLGVDPSGKPYATNSLKTARIWDPREIIEAVEFHTLYSEAKDGKDGPTAGYKLTPIEIDVPRVDQEIDKKAPLPCMVCGTMRITSTQCTWCGAK